MRVSFRDPMHASTRLTRLVIDDWISLLGGGLQMFSVSFKISPRGSPEVGSKIYLGLPFRCSLFFSRAICSSCRRASSRLAVSLSASFAPPLKSFMWYDLKRCLGACGSVDVSAGCTVQPSTMTATAHTHKYGVSLGTRYYASGHSLKEERNWGDKYLGDFH